MKKTTRLYLQDLNDAIEKIQEYIKGMNEEQFGNDSKTQDSVLRRLQIVGEAVKKLPRQYTQKYDHIPWKKIAATRDKIVHDYDGVDMSIVWDITQKFLPEVHLQIRELLEKGDHEFEG